MDEIVGAVLSTVRLPLEAVLVFPRLSLALTRIWKLAVLIDIGRIHTYGLELARFVMIVVQLDPPLDEYSIVMGFKEILLSEALQAIDKLVPPGKIWLLIGVDKERIGPIVSTLQLTVCAEPVFPAPSNARTERVWDPSDRAL